MKALYEALQVEQFGLAFNDEVFLNDLHVVVEQLLQWPPAWRELIDLLDPKRPWTEPYCDKVLGGERWSPVSLVRQSSIIPQQTMAQVEKESPHVGAAMKRWLDSIRSVGDSQAQVLLKALKANETADVRNKTVHARPVMCLMQQQHARLLQHIMGRACKGRPLARAKFEKSGEFGLTVLHHAASVGDAAAVRAIIRATPKGKRAEFAGRRDSWGYTAEDWARLGDFDAAASAIQAARGGTTASAKEEPEGSPRPPEEPLERWRGGPAAAALFPVPEGGAAEGQQCRIFAGAAGADACAASAAQAGGGWNAPDPAAVPADWLPPAGEPCDAGTIDAAQFDFETFMVHYVLHPRPLLIRGGAKMPADVARSYTREGLQEAAGDRKVSAELFVQAQQYDGSKPMTKRLHEYLKFLDERSGRSAARKLHYVYEALAKDEATLNFTLALPELLAGKVNLTGSSFYVGGLFMGLPPHHHGPVANSLVHGAKLWFFEPPGRELIVQKPMYDFLADSGGAPGWQRCLQEAGDLLFMPKSWTHGAICLGDCVGASHGLTHERWVKWQ